MPIFKTLWIGPSGEVLRGEDVEAPDEVVAQSKLPQGHFLDPQADLLAEAQKEAENPSA